MFKMPCFHKLRLNRRFYIFITAHALKLIQQYGRLNTVTMVIFVLIFVSMDMQVLYTETDKFIYKALTLHGKQLLLKHDRSRSHKSAV